MGDITAKISSYDTMQIHPTAEAVGFLRKVS